jgi:tetratricopeptide (TPR) repeat protein
VETGIEFHDNKEYDKAINTYKIALDIAPNSSLVNYELALSFREAQQYDSAIKYSDKVIELNKQFVSDAYMIKGSSQDYAGKLKESIETLEKASRKYKDNYLLFYSLGLTLFKDENYSKSEEAIINAIKINPDHASSHLLLATVNLQKNQTVPSLLGLYYFLLLEPNSERSTTAYNMLRSQLTTGVQSDPDDPTKISIYMDPDPKTDEAFKAAELSIKLRAAASLSEDNKDKTEEEIFLNTTKSLFGLLGELKTKKTKGFYWDGYVDFFSQLSKTDYMETYCHYISFGNNQKSTDWLMANKPQLKKFGEWLENTQMKP